MCDSLTCDHGMPGQIVTEKELVLKLLNQYKKSPCLWDTENKYYSNKQVRAECYESMLGLWRQLAPRGTVATLKKKLEHYRAAYRREWKKVENSVVSVSDGEEVYKPNLWYYNYMTFLNIKSAGKSREISSDEEVVKSDYVHNPYKRKCSPLEQEKNGIAEEKIKTEKTEEPLESLDSVTLYGQTIARQLSELEDSVRYEAERYISDVIYKARTGTLAKYNPQAVDSLIIPQSEPSWYDIPAPAVLSVTESQTPDDYDIKTELTDTDEV